MATPCASSRALSGADLLDRCLVEAPGAGPTAAEAAALLAAQARGALDPALEARLYAAARELRRRHFGEGIFLYGFLYASTYCRNDCRFCFYRRSNPESGRYRKSPSAIRAAALRLTEGGVHLIDLTMGEDPQLREPGGGEALARLVSELKAATGLPLMVSPGVLPRRDLEALRGAGADWYGLYQETHSRRLFGRLRPGQSYEERWQAKLDAQQAGLLVEEGVLCGVGESPAQLAGSIEAMRRLHADQVRAMRFVHQPGVPLRPRRGPDAATRRERLMIALMRLAFPDRLIPASLDVEGLEGLTRRLEAGANVVTSIVPAGESLAGVAQVSLDIEEGRRSVQAAVQVLEHSGCRAATAAEYAAYLSRRRAARPAAVGRAQ
jgi:methylornithine synthase